MEIENKIENAPVKKNYYKTFYSKHHDKIIEKHVCEFCNGSYTYFTKSQHRNSLKCIKATKGLDAYINKKMEKLKEKHTHNNVLLISEPKTTDENKNYNENVPV
jgi:hypothetical protein